MIDNGIYNAHPCGPIVGSLQRFDQLDALLNEAYAAYRLAQTEADAAFWWQEAEALENMIMYCQEHWSAAYALAICKAAQR